MIKAPWRALTALVLLAAIGCGDDGGSEPEGSISVSASPTSLTLAQGSSGTVTVTLTRGGGFAEAVTVTVEGVPAGVTASVSPASLTGTTTQATVTVNVASTVPAGSYPITVRASAAGIGAATTQYTLVVTAAPVSSYTLSAAAASVAQGASGTSTISIQRTNFAGSVALTLDNPPAGITGTFNPASTTGNTSDLTINVAGTVAPGTYNLTVKGTATGQTDKTATVALTVTAPNYALSASPATLTIAPAGNSNTTININRTGFTGSVTLTLDAPPTGITATFNPASTTGNSSTATINVAGTVAPGNHTLTIKGTATGIADKTTTVALTVSAAGTFSISASPPTMTIPPGTNQVSTITIARTNLTADIALSLVNPPTGITGTFTPATLTGSALTSSLQISVAGSVAPGSHTLTVQGVGGGVTQTTTIALTVGAAGTFTISASPATMTIAPGANQTSTITIARTNLTADIALSLVNPPTGITGTFTPPTLTGSILTSSLQVSVAGTVAPGSHTLTVQGAGGSVTQTTTIALTVAASSVTLSMQPTTLSIQQGSSSNATLNLNRVNFTGNVTPSVTGNPAGMTLTFSPNPITGNSAQVTVNVGASTPVGTHNLTITGAAGTAGNPTTQLAVTVTASTGGSNLTWDFCTAEGVPIKFWRLSGTTWAEVTPTVVGNVTRFSFSIATTTGGIAYTMQASSLANRTADGPSKLAAMVSTTRKAREKAQSALRLTNQTLPQTTSYYDTYVQLALTSELGGYAEVCGSPSTPASKTFNVTGLGASEVGLLGYGPGSAGLSPSTTTYNLSVEPGTYDWAAIFGPTPGLPDFASNYTAYRNGRNETAPGAAVSVNRTGATAFSTVPFTVSGASAGSLNLFSEFIEGARGAIIGFSLGSPFNSTTSGNMLFFAPADRLATDLTSFAVLNAAQVGTAFDLRSTTRYYGAPPASATFTLPGAIPAFTVSQVNGAPVTTWSVAGSIPAEYQTAVTPIAVTFEGNNGNAYISIAATRGWLLANSMGTNYTLTQPTLPNFLSQWAAAAPLASTTVIMLGYDELVAPTAGSVINFGGRVQTP